MLSVFLKILLKNQTVIQLLNINLKNAWIINQADSIYLVFDYSLKP